MKNLFIILLVVSCLTSQAQWPQAGQDIDGEAAGDWSGNSVSLSSDGKVVAIGAPNNDGNGDNSGHVRVYENIGGTWTQVGQDIDGEAAFDRSGNSVSLSSDGSIVAIGAFNNDGNGNGSGHVRVYENISGTWTQVGQDIDGEAAGDWSGRSVSLSSDGTVVAIGAPTNAGNGTNSGHVRVYENISGTWTQVGQDIDGEAALDGSGGSVSLSSDGSMVAIGAVNNDGNGDRSGHVRVFENIGGTWTQVGQDIDGEAAGDISGGSVSLSSDGSVVAIGAVRNDGNGDKSGHVRVFENISGTWTQVGQDIDGEAAGDESGNSVSLSSDGTVVAIGAHWNDGNGDKSGHVRVFENISGTWTQVGQDIDGEAAGDESGSSVSLNSDGSMVAIGAPVNDGNGDKSGHVRVFYLTWLLSDFSADPDTLCEGDSVTFTDLSVSIDSIISWQWTFEGGTPASSSIQNPVITYNDDGDYNVQLIVSDGIYTDTLLQTDFIHVESVPDPPDTPDGPTELCQEQLYNYTTAGVPYAEVYNWQVIPTDAGTITGDSTSAVFEASQSWTGTFDIQVNAVGPCGTSPWSASLTCELYNIPYSFELSGTGDGGYCEGDPGSELTLDGSETGVDYELYLDGQPTGNIVAGTGDSISFGVISTEGYYSAIGFTDYCEEYMLEQVYVHQWDLPGQAETPMGNEETCDNESDVYTTEDVEEADWYVWTLDPVEAGVLTPSDDSVTITWNSGFSGNASLSVHGENDCGAGPESDPLIIDVSLSPDPVISGPQYVIPFSEEQYETEENSGNTYEWEVSGGDITSGGATHQVTVLWGGPGEGSLIVTEESAEGCSGSTNPYLVVIDESTSIEKNYPGKVQVYPNPANETLHISFHADAAEDVVIRITTLAGKSVYSSNLKASEGENLFRVATADLMDGIYILNMSNYRPIRLVINH
ncbi:MAG: PKD domain-containing protein [Chlorobi bacterium]|nr:PKD domain-containing protein [Chlorobiota bacterium]